MVIEKNGKAYHTGQTNERACKCVHCGNKVRRGEGYCHVDKSTFVYTCKEHVQDYLASNKGMQGKQYKHGFIFDYKVTLYNQKEVGNLVNQGYQQISKASLRFASSGLNVNNNVDYKLQSAMVVLYDTILQKRYMLSFTHTTFAHVVQSVKEYAIARGMYDYYRY